MSERFASRTSDRSGVTAPVLGDGSADYTPGVSRTASGTTTFAHAGLKNTSTQSAENETVAATKVYDAFGNTVSSSGTWSGPFAYAGNYGYQEDPNGLKLLGHRYYDPSAGRFLSRDRTKHGRNWYAYCLSGPVANADPTGLIVFGGGIGTRIIGLGFTGSVSLEILIDTENGDAGLRLTGGGGIGMGIAMPGFGFGLSVQDGGIENGGSYGENTGAQILPVSASVATEGSEITGAGGGFDVGKTEGVGVWHEWTASQEMNLTTEAGEYKDFFGRGIDAIRDWFNDLQQKFREGIHFGPL